VNAGLKNRSDNVVSDDKLVAFLYLLLRDHVVGGDIELIMKQLEKADGFEYTNGYMAAYAINIAERLRSKVE